ncbi:AGE family epimerase/isomerase [Mucilaginibacter sp. McL0603]|uniref:AGE family epimerase/isomerase n=1 Tax=Mucilaginibacter sp. McL0603 TaxID=3415670 RepID=UPI003CF0379E
MIKTGTVESRINTYKKELSAELGYIMDYWINNTQDIAEGGFYGKIDNDNRVIPASPKGSVLNARILWSFSAAYNLTDKKEYLEIADKAYQYIIDYIIDRQFGGVYWTVDHLGNKLDIKKQVYASAFAIYAFSEYYKATGKKDVLNEAIRLFMLLVDKSFDQHKTGYLEAFTEDWQPIGDLRLSAKDANEKKTMNTHLHVLEGYTNLYRVWPGETLKKQIGILLNNFLDHFIDTETGHLNLFFDEEWNKRSTLTSYGHDIEAAWLMLESAEVIGDGELTEKLKAIAIKISEATLEGLDTDGGLWYEYEPAKDHLTKEKHWWVQAEAMIGFFNTWQITGHEKYLDVSTKNWDFVKNKILDKENGEWFWGIYENGKVMATEDKAGLWKCPYHNSRACIEIIKRIDEISNYEKDL